MDNIKQLTEDLAVNALDVLDKKINGEPSIIIVNRENAIKILAASYEELIKLMSGE